MENKDQCTHKQQIIQKTKNKLFVQSCCLCKRDLYKWNEYGQTVYKKEDSKWIKDTSI